MDAVLEVAIPFDCIIDYEMGLNDLITLRFRGGNHYMVDEMANTEVMKVMLRDRLNPNPLSVMVTDRYMTQEEMDDELSQFMDQYYDDIMALAHSTNLLKAITLTGHINDTNAIRYRIVCKDDKEVNILRKRNIDCPVYIGSISDKQLLDEVSSIFVRNGDVLKEVDIDMKNVYVANLGTNLIPIGNGDMMLKLMEDNDWYFEHFHTCKVSLFDLYTIDYEALTRRELERVPYIEEE